jgi:uncharacterized membrane protein YcaP (DUF421 family)
MADQFVAFDITRLMFGEEPPFFLIEIGFRTVFIYLYTLLLIRWIGSRSIAQLSLVEFLLVIALGSAVGDAMFYPDVPLFHCMVVITVVVLLYKGLSYLVARHPALEDAIEGKSVEVIRNGLIDCDALRSGNFGHDELFEQLRIKDVTHLGQVRAAYLETNGMLSVFKMPGSAVKPGLPIEPPWDVLPPEEFKAGQAAPGTVACPNCGTIEESQSGALLPKCRRCGSEKWHSAGMNCGRPAIRES